MTPKKSIPSKNSISHCGSSSCSSLPTLPIRDRFYDLKSQKNFDENIYDWVIHLELQVILLAFFRHATSRCVSLLRLGLSLREIFEVSSVSVHEFYSNIHAIDTSIP